MDSPLLPSIKRHADVTASPAGLMSNMSLEPLGEGDSFMFEPTGQPRASVPSSGSTSTSTHASASGASARLDGSTAGRSIWDEEPVGETPQPRRTAPRFSLFAPGASASTNPEEEPSPVPDQLGDSEQGKMADRGRDDKLRESLYELRQMNEVFEGFLVALEAAKGHNERLAARVKETSALIDMYTNILGQSEHTLSLVRNPNWSGALDDVRALQEAEDRRFAEEQAALEAAEAARAAQQQRAADAAKREKEKEPARAVPGAVPAVRGGTRGRGAPRGVARGSGIPPPGSRGGRPPSDAGLRKPSAGLGGQYSHVKGSGYGPAPHKPAV